MSGSQALPTFKVGLTPDEKKLYSQLFKSLDPENTGIITGEKSRSTFESSGLPPAILGEIWQIADQDNLGFLNQFGFCHAMRLIGYTQAGHHPTPGLADVPGPLPKFANLTLQPQSTSSSFLSNQPVGPASVPQASPQSSQISPLSAADYQKFSQLFIRTVGSAQGELGGEQARDILLKAKLPTPVLGQIWTLVDRYNTGKLNVGSFAIAMHLIQGLLSGSIKQLPPFLPDSVWQSVEQQQQQQPDNTAQVQARQVSHSSTNSQSTAIRHPPGSRNVSTATVNNEWSVSPAMKQQYQSIFNNLDKEKTGHLNPDQVASFLMTSKLSQQDLATVWDLSDIQNSGIFTILEFSIALFLVNRKLSGGELPNIVPDALLASLQEPQAPTESPVQAKTSISPAPATTNLDFQKPQLPKSSIDDLVDVFGPSQTSAPVSAPSSAPTSANNPPVPSIAAPIQPTLQQRTSSSDLSKELPKARPNFTGSFKPTSTFGQSLMKQTNEEPKEVENLIHDEKPKELSPPVDLAPPEAQQKTINYEALRSVPPPPQKRSTSSIPPSTPPPIAPQFSSNRSISQPPVGNDDLLADPAISGQMSQATSDIANFSNQIKSLASQTSNLHEKKIRAEQELQKILQTKSDIENKLKQLRVSYDNEVKQVEQVESNLVSAKEETEALRSEASIAEAKVNSLSAELNDKQLTMEELQKENASLKERLSGFNVEIAELEKEVASKVSETQSLSNQVNVKKSQVQVSIVKCEELKKQIAETEESHKQLQLELDNAERERLANEREQQELRERQAELERSKPTTASSGIVAAVAAGAVAAGVVAAGVVHYKEEGAEESTEEVANHAVVETQDKEVKNDDEDINKRFPDLSVSQPEEDRTNITSSIATDNADENETPITSPSNSDFQFPQAGNAGIAGGMVGMPGVLVGVQRTDSLTSSVQNNAALSVRDDNIDEISDRETLEDIGDGEESVPNTADTENFENERRGEGSDKGSSGHESFELVNSEEARGHSEEFPPIKELDYQESDSSDDEHGFADAVDKLTSPVAAPVAGAVDKLTSPVAAPVAVSVTTPESTPVSVSVTSPAPTSATATTTAPVTAPEETLKAPDFDDFETAFNNLQPATPEVTKNGIEDAFGNEFDDLEAAQVDNEEVEEFGAEDFGGLSSEFTNSNAPDFTNGGAGDDKAEGNDEWEQLFAGFGNANVATTETNPLTSEDVQQSPSNIDSSQVNEFAVQELIGMGFDEKTATDALEKENWNLEAATNYLLDNA